MYVHLYIDPAAAVRAGKARSGHIRLDLTDDDLAQLSEEERGELAKCGWLGEEERGDQWYVNRRPLGDGGDPKIITADVESIRTVLQWRLGARERDAAKDAEEAQKRRENTLAVLRERRTKTKHVAVWAGFDEGELRTDVDCFQPSHWDYPRSSRAQILAQNWPYLIDEEVTASPEAQEWQAELDRENNQLIADAAEHAKARARNAKAEAEESAARVAQFQEAYRAFVEEHGTDNQRERQVAGMLPEDEVLAMIRDSLFGDLSASRFAAYRKRTIEDIEHSEGCPHEMYGDDADVDCSFEVEDAETCDAQTWTLFQEIKAIAGNDAEVELREHVGTCGECEARNTWYSARVAYQWHGREFVREYGLDI